MTRHEAFDDAREHLELRLRLHRLLAGLRRHGLTPSVEEWAEAVAVALASKDLVAHDLHRVAARLRTVLLKTPEPVQGRKFDEAFRAAFTGDPMPRPEASGEGGRKPPGPRKPGDRRWFPLAVLVSVLAVVALALGVYLLQPAGNGGEENGDPDPVGHGVLGTVGGGASATEQQAAEDPLQHLRRVAEIGFRIHLAADRAGRLNLRSVARTFSTDRPPTMAHDFFIAQLSRRTGIDPSSIFVLDARSRPVLTREVHHMITGAQEANPDVLALVTAVLSQLEPGDVPIAGENPVGEFRPLPGSIMARIQEDAIMSLLPLDEIELLPEIAEGSLEGLNPADLRNAIVAAAEQAVAKTIHSGRPLLGGPEKPPVIGHAAAWPVFVLAGGVPLALLLWRFATLRRRLRAWFRKRTPEHGITPHYLGGLHEALDRAVGSDARVRAARDLARPILQRTSHLDVERTAIATARNAGRLVPVRRMARRTPRYLALIVTEGPDDHQAQRYAELVRSFGRLRTTTETWFIDYDGNSVYQSFDDFRQTVADLRARLPDYRLLVLGAGDVFLDRATMQAHSWARVISRWPAAALLTPVPPERWGARSGGHRAGTR